MYSEFWDVGNSHFTCMELQELDMKILESLAEKVPGGWAVVI